MDHLPSILRPHGRDRAHDLEKDGMSSNSRPFPSPPPIPHRPTMLEPEAMHQLNAFRHMVGIHSTKGFVSSGIMPKASLFSDNTQVNLHFEGRAAPNVGIYNRVCHRERQAKRGYKFAAIFINGCLGLQIIVAAALTAMGAANSNHVGITAFGAINTVIAGILTYLKGSGLPNRIRFYEQQWKKVREFIEQRERDFSRPDCQLDVNEVVSAIEAMYEEVKADVATNTPDSYTSVSDMRGRSAVALNSQFPKMPNAAAGIQHARDTGRSKFEDLELKYGHKVTDFLESLAHKEEERLKRIEGDIEHSKSRALAALQEGRSAVHGGREQWDKELEHARIGARDFEKDFEMRGARMAERELEHARTGVSEWEKDLEKKSATVAAHEIEHTKSSILQRGLSFAKNVETAKEDVLRRGNDITRDLDKTKAAALERGRDYQSNIEGKTARFAETEKDLEREAERARLQAQQAADSIHRVGDNVQRAGESIERISKAVDDEIQPRR